MADYSKHENHHQEKGNTDPFQGKESCVRSLGRIEQLASRNWHKFSPEGRKKVHNERFHSTARVNGPIVQTNHASTELEVVGNPIQYQKR